MKGRSIAFVFGLALAMSIAVPASAQKIIHIGKTHRPAADAAHVKHEHSAHERKRPRVRRYGKLAAHWRAVHLRRKKLFRKRIRFSGFALPEQTLFPPYYDAFRPWAERPDMASRIESGKTVEQGSRWRSRIPGGKTVEGGSRYRGHMKGGRTVEGGSRWASRIPAGRTVEGGSQWASTMPNWTFSGYTAPMRLKGIPYYRASRHRRSPWAGRRY